MSKKLVSDLLVDYLERRGVTKLFGLCGHTVIGIKGGQCGEKREGKYGFP